jgi:hypothetical protein
MVLAKPLQMHEGAVREQAMTRRLYVWHQCHYAEQDLSQHAAQSFVAVTSRSRFTVVPLALIASKWQTFEN